jgi:hypothetical protein
MKHRGNTQKFRYLFFVERRRFMGEITILVEGSQSIKSNAGTSPQKKKKHIMLINISNLKINKTASPR